MARPQKPKPSKDPSQEELENQDLELQSQSLEEKASRELDPKVLKQVKKISYYVSKVGLPINEACALVDIDFDYFKQLMITEPIIKKIIEMKELEYKKDLLKTLSERARGGDDKLAQWLLERRHPEEYGQKKKGGGGDTGDFIMEAIEFIQKSGENSPMVKETAGRAVIVKKIQQTVGPAQPVKSDAVKTLENLLG